VRKKDRHRLLVRLLAENEIQKQEEFVEILKEKGIEVTQATISRDMKEMNLIKVPSSTGGYKYSLPAETAETIKVRINRAFNNSVLSVKISANQVIVKTIPGSATALKQLLAKRFEEELFGIFSDDDGVLLLFASAGQASSAYRELEMFE
jgi:transcriptional regulator of arginine metabolism